MIAPYDHLGEFDSAPKETTDEMMDLAKRCQTALREVYHPHGFNLGMNLGRAGGAGIPDHIHLPSHAALDGRHKFHFDGRRDARAF